jgi:hypothetical protein
MVSPTDSGHPGIAQKKHMDDMLNIIQETSYRLSGRISFAAGQVL